VSIDAFVLLLLSSQISLQFELKRVSGLASRVAVEHKLGMEMCDFQSDSNV
jgi:hypothetical protein